MSLLKKAVSVGTSAALLASLFATAIAPAASAATVNPVTGLGGAVGGEGLSAGVALVSFSPVTAIGAGTTVSVTLPGVATVSTTAANWTISEGAATHAPASVTWDGTTHVATFLVDPGSVVALPYTFSIIAAGAGPWATNGTVSGSFPVTVATQVGDSGSTTETIAGGAITSVTISPAPTATVAAGAPGGTLQFTATCRDTFSNVVPCGTVTWTATAGTGTGSIDASGLYTAGNAGTVTVTGTANAVVSAATTVTNSATAASVTCTPSGGSIAVGSTVTCTFNAGFPPAAAPTFTATGFTGTFPTFTAATVGAGAINVTGSVTATFTYTITAAAAGIPTVGGSSVTITSVGTVPIDSTSTNSLTITLPEQARNAFPNATAYVTIAITDSAGNATVTFDGTPTVSAPGSLEASASTSSNKLTVKIKHSDTANFETITITGLKIKVAAGAGLGSMKAFLVPGQNFPASGATGDDLAFYNGLFSLGAAAGDASGVVTIFTSHGVGSIPVTTSLLTLQFNTRYDDSICGSNPDLGPIIIGSGATQETALYPVVTPADSLRHQTVTLFNDAAHTVPATLLYDHAAGETVTQTNVCGFGGDPNGATLSSPGSVASKVKLDKSSQPLVRAGRNNEPAGNLTVAESQSGNITTGTTMVFKIATSGVVFSTVPTVAVTAGDLALSGSTPPKLSSDRTTLTVTVAAASTVASTVTISNIKYDIASTVTAGTKITVTLTLSNGLAVDPVAGVANAVVSFAIAPTAAQPTIYIGENGQATGMITFTEAGPGFFTDSTGSANKFWVCVDSGETFTNAPYAIVSSGDLKLLATDGTAATTVKGRPLGGTSQICYFWSVYSKSTTASTIQIVGQAADGSALAAGPNNGPLVNVPSTMAPGTTQMSLHLGTILTVTGTPTSDTLFGSVANAVRKFRNSLAIVALSQPTIGPGSIAALAGNLQLTETQLGQLDKNAVVCVEVVPRGSSGLFQAKQDVFFGAANTNDLPIITTNGNASGLLASQVSGFSQEPCVGNDSLFSGTVLTQVSTSFSFMITQGSVNTLGQITISNIKYTALSDAAKGPVQVAVYVTKGNGIQQSQGLVTNATIGSPTVADAWIAKGLNVRAASAFGLATAVVKRGAYVTIRVKVAGAAPGTLVQIWVKTKTTAWHVESSRRVSTDGYAYYSAKVLNLGYRYYKGSGGGAISNVVRGFGK